MPSNGGMTIEELKQAIKDGKTTAKDLED